MTPHRSARMFLGAGLLGALAVSCGDESEQSRAQPATGPAQVLTVTAVTIAGPASVPPGDSAQFTAMLQAERRDGKGRDDRAVVQLGDSVLDHRPRHGRGKDAFPRPLGRDDPQGRSVPRRHGTDRSDRVSREILVHARRHLPNGRQRHGRRQPRASHSRRHSPSSASARISRRV